MQTHEFLTPDYYPQFHCKMGACRRACCEGWPITFSLQDYFNLLSLDCSEELRRKLDISLHIAPHPTPDGYAQILPRFDGQCPMRLEDGRCALHAEKGEEVLSAVCRLYPRGVRSGGSLEVSCANSCEGVLELLLHWPEPMTFSQRTLTIDTPSAFERKHVFETAGREKEIRLWFIRILQDRTQSLSMRLIRLGVSLHAVEQAIANDDHALLDDLLTGRQSPAMPQLPTLTEDQKLAGLDAACHMLTILNERSDSIRDFGEETLAYLSGDDAAQRYAQATQALENLLPAWENWFEQMMVNHMFFEQFPFQDRPVPLKDEFLAVCAVYALLRLLCITHAALHHDMVELVDVCAAAFRLVEHTNFDRYATLILRELGCTEPGPLQQLLSI